MNANRSKSQQPKSEILRISDLKKSFANLPVIDGIDLAVSDGEFVSILGPSGCGKTTIFNLIVGLQKSDNGAIELNGEQIRGLNHHFAYMQQKDLLLPWRRVIDNVLIGPEICGKITDETRSRAIELIEWIGLGGFEKHFPSQLSGGMRQRVALCRTLISDKKFLLLDEPFGAIDAITRSSMHEILFQVWRKFRRTILLISHDIEEVLKLSNRVYILSERPAKIRSEILINLDFPREIDSPNFIKLKKDLLQMLKN